MKKIKLLSLVVPAYKQEKTIIEDIKNLDKVLSSLPFRHEIIVVVDGFLDKTYVRIKNQESRIKNLHVFGYAKNCGKGYAVQFGIAKAEGDIIGFIDAGMDIDPTSIPALLSHMETKNADIAIGSKLHPQSKVKYPFVRKILSWGYQNIVHLLFGLNVRDTQAGLKLFKRKVAKEVFPKLTVKTFAFDIEALVIAKEMGYEKIYEAPVKLNFRKGTITRLNFFIVALKMLVDTVKVFSRVKTNYYK